MRLKTLLCGLLIIAPLSSVAERVCLRSTLKNGKLKVSKVVTSRRCPRGTLELINTSRLTGPQGQQGAVGATGPVGATGTDGSIRVYGDGSAGPLNISSSTSLSGFNHQYTDITIASGATLTVPSGTVLRCSGSFVNNGVIQVQSVPGGGIIETSSSTASGTPAIRVAGYGEATGPAGTGEYGTNAAALFGGGPAPALSSNFAGNIRYPLPVGCAAGAGGIGGGGGSSGGTLVILCQGQISNSSTGQILAQGQPGASGGGGGGSGGIIILASPVSVTNSGAVAVNGGAGGSSTSRSGAGGGGGGGFVHVISPEFTSTAAFTLGGGAAGMTTTTVSSSPRFGGGAGGSCAGQGGFGASISPTNVQSGVTAGSNGYYVHTSADPTSLF